MTWTADTLKSPDNTSIQLLMQNICAFSANDIWITGWCDVSSGLIWHYNGQNWTMSDIGKDVGAIRINDIAGNSSTDLWACGYSNDYRPEFYAAFAHFDGHKWTKAPHTGVLGEVIDMTRAPDGSLWACARNNVVFKLINGNWVADTIKISYEADKLNWLRGIEYYKDRIFIISTTADPHTEKYHYITGDIKNWTIQDSFLVNSSQSKFKWGNQALISGNTGKLYSIGLEGIWEYQVGNWNKSYSIDCTIRGGMGTRSDYILAMGDFKQVLFFNGSTWDNFYGLLARPNDSIVFANAWTNEYETFIIGYTAANNYMPTIVWHGK